MLALLRHHPVELGFGVFLTFVSSFGQTFFISLFGAELRAAFDLGHAGLGSIYSVATLMSATALIWVGRLVDRWSLAALATLVVAGLATAAVTLALAPGLPFLLLALFGLRLCGQGMASHIAMTTMARSFSLDRGKAISIAGLGMPLGEVIFPLLAVAAIAAGWRTSWLAFALVLIVLALPLARRLGRQVGERTARRLEAATRAANATSGDAQGWSRSQVLADPRFYLLLPGLLAPAFIVTGIFFHQAHIVESRGWDLLAFASAFTGYALAAVLGSLAGGMLVDRLSAVGAIRFAPFLLALGALSLALPLGAAGAWPMMIVLGLSQGIQGVATSALWAELYGTRHLGAIRALATSLMVLGSALSPALLGALLDEGVSVDAIAQGCALYAVLGGLLMVATLRHGAGAKTPCRAGR